MRVYCLNTLDELAPYAEDWNRLAAGLPFRGWTWLSTWWRHYGGDGHRSTPRRRLHVLCVFDQADALVGVAPLYLDRSAVHGRVLRLLGSGEVCSDYLGVLCQPGLDDRVAEAIADYLINDARSIRSDTDRWDLLELTGIDAEDRVMERLLAHLRHPDKGVASLCSFRGERRTSAQYSRTKTPDPFTSTVHCRPGLNCWRIELPTTWEAYLATLSRNWRHQFRTLERDYLRSSRATLQSVDRLEELNTALDLMIQLHQRSWRERGEPGCYASPRFAAFCRDVAAGLLRQGQARLYRLDLDGRPVAIEFLLAGDGVLYAYQSGVEPDARRDQPGKLCNFLVIQQAIEQGYRAVDFLRGDEPYKAHLRATPRPTFRVRIVPHRPAAQLRHSLWLAGSNMKGWIKQKRWKKEG